MARTIIYYDENGEILCSKSGNYKQPAGQVAYIETEIPSGYIPVSVGENGAVVTEALPLTEEQMQALFGAEA